MHEINVQDLCIVHKYEENTHMFERYTEDPILELPIQKIGIEKGKFVLKTDEELLDDVIEVNIIFYWPIDRYPVDPETRLKSWVTVVLRRDNGYKIDDEGVFGTITSSFRQCDNIDVHIFI